MEPVKIPRQIDEPPIVLMWSVEELLPVVFGLIVGMLLGRVLIPLFLGMLATGLYNRFRDGRPEGYLQHALYWFGFPISTSNAKTIPNPMSRHFLP